MDPEEVYVGLDMGKTKLAVGLVTGSGKILKKDRVLTDWSDNGAKILDQSKELIHKIIKEADVKPKGIGIGNFALVDQEKGIIVKSSVKSWVNTPIKKIFEEEFGLPVMVNNDVEVAALAEHLFGASMGTRASVYVTISSGIGAASIIEGRVWHGTHSLAGHIGHIIIGEDGRTVDDSFSGWGISESVSKISNKKVTPEEAFDMVMKDPSHHYSKVIEHAVKSAALVIAILQNTIDPEIIVLGGSIAVNQKKFVEDIKKEVERLLAVYMVQMPKGINLVTAKLKADNGIMGAAGLFIASKQNKKK